MTSHSQVPTGPFGTVFAETMSVARWKDGSWGTPGFGPVEPFSFHPATHVLHYGSACFEGLKAHRGLDGRVRVFRLDRHVERMQKSAQLLYLPAPDSQMLTTMVSGVVAANLDQVPSAPGSLYLRPTLVGTEENIGAAAVPSKEALLYVLASPVGDYFAGGARPLRLLVETHRPRTTPQFGMVKSGANYVMALGITMRAKAEQSVDQVLFAPGGVVQETGAANFLLIDSDRIVTPALTESFLHGVTRDSVLRIALDLGYQIEEREVGVEEIVEWAGRTDAEAALSGTAAILAPVGTLVIDGQDVPVGTGDAGANTLRLRKALTDLHVGATPDIYGWLSEVE